MSLCQENSGMLECWNWTSKLICVWTWQLVKLGVMTHFEGFYLHLQRSDSGSQVVYQSGNKLGWPRAYLRDLI